MFLLFRPATPADLPDCLPLTRDLCAFDSAQREPLLWLWRALLKNRAVNFMIIEDVDRPPSTGIAYFCIIAFVAETFAAEMKTTLPPFIGRQVLDRWQAGHSPILELEAVRRANTCGELAMVCLQSGLAEAFISGESGREVRDKMVEWMWHPCNGYRLREYFIEAYTPFSREWQQAAGWRVRRDYADHYTASDMPPPPEEGRACLMSLSREEALATEGTVVSTMFLCRSPRFGFTLAEQDLMLGALTGETDERLAQKLNLAAITIRKRWESIYGRISLTAPEFFGPTFGAEARRGTEKRRRVLTYIRQHMEEVRPFMAPNKANLTRKG